jgi:hypothetical protein
MGYQISLNFTAPRTKHEYKKTRDDRRHFFKNAAGWNKNEIRFNPRNLLKIFLRCINDLRYNIVYATRIFGKW